MSPVSPWAWATVEPDSTRATSPTMDPITIRPTMRRTIRR
jgi:hypothetical protein